jgi:hypothetical protein
MWIESKIGTGFVVKNSGWATGNGPNANEIIPIAGTAYSINLINLPVDPGTVSLTANVAGNDYTITDNGVGGFNGMTTPGIVAVPAPAIVYSNGLLTFTTSAIPASIRVQYRFGPWMFEWVAVQDQ